MSDAEFIYSLELKFDQTVSKLRAYQEEVERLLSVAADMASLLRTLGVDVEAPSTRKKVKQSGGPAPRVMRKNKEKGYIKMTVEDILPKYPDGATLDQLVAECFTCSTKAEMTRVKKSYKVELCRAIREGRLIESPDGLYRLKES